MNNLAWTGGIEHCQTLQKNKQRVHLHCAKEDIGVTGFVSPYLEACISWGHWGRHSSIYLSAEFSFYISRQPCLTRMFRLFAPGILLHSNSVKGTQAEVKKLLMFVNIVIAPGNGQIKCSFLCVKMQFCRILILGSLKKIPSEMEVAPPHNMKGFLSSQLL